MTITKLLREVWGLTAIILTILKWMGIIVLAILGVILVLVACLLFVPVRYHIFIEKNEQLSVKGNGSWLLHLLHVSLLLRDGKSQNTIRILGIPLSGKRKKKRKKAVSSPRKKKTSPESSPEQTSGTGETRTESIRNIPETEDSGSHKDRQETQVSHPPQDRRKAKDSVIRQFFLSIRRLFGKIKKVIQFLWTVLWEGLPEKSSQGTLAKLQTVLADENTPLLWALVWENLLLLLKHSQPRKWKGFVRFGTDDPCTTGQILGAIGAAYAIVGNKVQVIPDFEQAVLECDVEIKGRIRLCVLLLVAKRVFFSQQWKHFKKQME